jgi:hypothetical protein
MRHLSNFKDEGLWKLREYSGTSLWAEVAVVLSKRCLTFNTAQPEEWGNQAEVAAASWPTVASASFGMKPAVSMTLSLDF